MEFKKNQLVKIKHEWEHFEKIALIDNIDESGNIRIRIYKGQKWAWQLIGIYPEYLEHYDIEQIGEPQEGGKEWEIETKETKTEPIEPPTEIKKQKFLRYYHQFSRGLFAIWILAIVSVIAFRAINWEPQKPKTFLEIKTEEINALEYQNLSDFEIQRKAMEVFEQAKERVKARDKQKNVLRSEIYLFVSGSTEK